MDFIKTAKSINARKIEELIDFNKYDVSLDGWQQFLDDVDNLFRDRDEDTKEKIRSAGGYSRIFDLADIYFQQSASTVQTVDQAFHKLLKLDSVTGDSNGYRFKIAKRYSDEYQSFAYPGDFIIALNMVLDNKEQVL